MWRNYVTVGLRSLTKNRAYALINIFGLAIGMAACLMILIFVRYETSYDEWLPGAESVYQFQAWTKDPQTGEVKGASLGRTSRLRLRGREPPRWRRLLIPLGSRSPRVELGFRCGAFGG